MTEHDSAYSEFLHLADRIYSAAREASAEEVFDPSHARDTDDLSEEPSQPATERHIAHHEINNEIKDIREKDLSEGDKINELLGLARDHMQYGDYVTIWQALSALEFYDLEEQHGEERDFTAAMAIGLIFGRFSKALEFTKQWSERPDRTLLEEGFDSLIHGMMLYRAMRNNEAGIEFEIAADHLQRAIEIFDAPDVSVSAYHRAQAYYYRSKCLRRIAGEDRVMGQDAREALTAAMDILKEASNDGDYDFELLSMEKDLTDFSNNPIWAESHLKEILTEELEHVEKKGTGHLRVASTMLRLARRLQNRGEPDAARSCALEVKSLLVTHFGTVHAGDHNFSRAADGILAGAMQEKPTAVDQPDAVIDS